MWGFFRCSYRFLRKLFGSWTTKIFRLLRSYVWREMFEFSYKPQNIYCVNIWRTFQPIFMKIQQIYIPIFISLSRSNSLYFSLTKKMWVPEVPQILEAQGSADPLFNNTQFQSIFLDRCLQLLWITKNRAFNQSLCKNIKKCRLQLLGSLAIFLQLFYIPVRSLISVILRQLGQPFRSSQQVPLSAVSRVRFKVLWFSFLKLNITAFFD